MGEVIRLWSGGGGGYGDPLSRDPEWVARDVNAGLVSSQRARAVYGVALRDGAVEPAETARPRNEDRATPTAYGFGPGRMEWEQVHGLAAGLIADWLPHLPPGVRRHAQTQVYRRLHATGPGPYDTAAVHNCLSTVTEQFILVPQDPAS